MGEWQSNVPGYRTKTMQRGSCTIIIHRPVLAPDEQAKREEQVKAAVGRVLGGHMKRMGVSA